MLVLTLWNTDTEIFKRADHLLKNIKREKTCILLPEHKTKLTHFYYQAIGNSFFLILTTLANRKGKLDAVRQFYTFESIIFIMGLNNK